MPGVKYEQLSTKAEVEEDVTTAKPKKKWSEVWCQKGLLSLGLILLYFSLSIGLTFYQRWLLKDFRYPLTVVMYHLIVKWCLSVCVRCARHFVTGSSQLVLPFMTCVRSVAPTGLASGIDVGFSNWGLELVTISLYTMTKSTTIIFILGFAILLGLERKSWSLVGIVFMIAAGLIMFTYKATAFNLLGFNFLLVASFAGGLRWTFAQLLMQRARLGLHNPVDMVFHVQPWMFLSLMPFALLFEGISCFEYLFSLPQGALVPTLIKVSGGATIAFLMEISEFLVVTYTSSLTLSIAGIFKEMCILVLAVEVSGDRLSPINVAGLGVCLLGIIGHIVHKVLFIKSVTGAVPLDDDFEPPTRSRTPKGGGEPLLEAKWTHPSDDSDVDANLVLFEVLQRRDGR
ncbi:solute carrier family 35 member C2 [Leguminivora glycinivorella]|uniref:solute carrier family 35 member C2 n=1 Tax=Leguminivora glycinivorella TaxID=1035111 RepID=UPI00200FE8C0|nr:solute carrier family 35 member C2 [Leguminivora glycinivorella]